MSQSGDLNFLLSSLQKVPASCHTQKSGGGLKKETKAERELNLGTIGLGN